MQNSKAQIVKQNIVFHFWGSQSRSCRVCSHKI